VQRSHVAALLGSWFTDGRRSSQAATRLTTAPLASGRTSLRATSGVFYDWLSQTTYEQVLRVDGVPVQELNSPIPTF
jgi:hypothetical protein